MHSFKRKYSSVKKKFMPAALVYLGLLRRTAELGLEH
jgi:hypothetical protein